VTTTVLCVLKLGGDYDARYVRALRAGAERSLAGQDRRFLCLTDDPSLLREPWAEPLRHGLPGWWSKLEAFRPGLTGKGERIVYLDLDTVLVRYLVLRPDGLGFAMLPGFNRRTNPRDCWASGVMAWDGGADLGFLLKRYLRERSGIAPGAWDQEYVARWYAEEAGREPEDVTLAVPGIVSYKKHVVAECDYELPDYARVVCFHGKPRPHQVSGLPWMDRYWWKEAGIGQSV
jgi:hypothetical protein